MRRMQPEPSHIRLRFHVFFLRADDMFFLEVINCRTGRSSKAEHRQLGHSVRAPCMHGPGQMPSQLTCTAAPPGRRRAQAVQQARMHATVQGGDYTQAARVGPDGLTLGPNNAGVTAQRDDMRGQTDISLKNVKVGPQGLEFNAGSRTNSSVSVSCHCTQPPLPAPCQCMTGVCTSPP